MSQEVANSLWALSELGWCRPDAPAVPAVAALHAAAQQRAADMNSQDVSNTLLALARLRNPVGDALQAALLLAIERVVAAVDGVATAQHVANTLWSLSQLRWQRAATVSEALLASGPACGGQHDCGGRGELAALAGDAAVAASRGGGRGAGSLRTRAAAADELSARLKCAVGADLVRGVGLWKCELDDGAFFLRASQLESTFVVEDHWQVRTTILWPARV